MTNDPDLADEHVLPASALQGINLPAATKKALSTVGAGDCTLFGYLLAEHRGLAAPDRLALAVAYGSAAAGLPGTTIPGPGDLHPERVRVRPLD